MICEKDFKEAPIKYKGEWTEVFYQVTDKYWEKLEEINNKIDDEHDMLSICEISVWADKNIEHMIKLINAVPEENREVLIIGRTKYMKPKYIVILGPISDNMYFKYFEER